MEDKGGENGFKYSKQSASIKSFENLDAWKLASELAVKVYSVSNSFPDSQRYGLTTQLHRAVVSISANIAEGFGRHATKEYLRFLFYARGSLTETQSHLRIANLLGFLGEPELNELLSFSARVGKTLHGLMRHIRQRTSMIAESAQEYPEALVTDNFLETFPAE